MRDVRACGGTAREEPERIKPGEGKYIHDWNPLEIRGIRQGHGQVEKQPTIEGHRKQTGAKERQHQKAHSYPCACKGGQISRGEGPRPLLRMMPISLDIEQIVDDVRCRCSD